MTTSGNGIESTLRRAGGWRQMARAVAVALGLCLVGPLGAAAQSNDELSTRSRLDQIESSVQDLQKFVFKGGTPPPSAATGGRSPLDDPNIANRLSGRITGLENQIRDLTGRIEEMQFMVRQVTDRVDKLVGDVDFRLSAIERTMPASQSTGGGSAQTAPRAAPSQGDVSQTGGVQPPGTLGTVSKTAVDTVAGGTDQAGSAAPATAVAAVSPPATASQTLPDGSVEERYQHAYTLLRTGKFEQAELAFKDFLSMHGDSDLAGNAQYWLGESYYVRRDYQNAAGAFLTGFQEYPDSRKAPDNLLKLASSLQALGHKEDACDTLVALAEKFPKASTRIKRTAQSIRRKTGCK